MCRKDTTFSVLAFAAIVWSWFPLWGQSNLPAFRDGFHFYAAQYHWLDQCYQRGEYFPLWNANEGLGSSVAGQPTWQLFYPLRMVWWIPGIDLPQRLAIWIVLHQWLAIIGIRRLGRELNLSSESSWMAAISFSLGCPVMFQYTNIIYLCSAVWVAFALAPIARWLQGRQVASSLWPFILCVCMMVLSGDPHTAIHAALIGGVAFSICICALVVGRRKGCGEGVIRTERLSNAIVVPASSRPWRNSAKAERSCANLFQLCGDLFQPPKSLSVEIAARISWLLVGLAVLGLTGVQTSQSLKWFKHSSRAVAVTQVTDSHHQVLAEILKSEPKPAHRVFDFSLSPSNLPSWIWPTVGGHYQSQHSRWLDALPGEGRMWMPSLYQGIIPALLAIGALTTIFGRRKDRSPNSHRLEQFLVWMSLFALLAAMGNYSLVWIFREMLNAVGLDHWTRSWPTDATGSLYGLLTTVIPGYDRFRYPAKWIVWFSAGASVLAAIHLDRSIQWNGRYLPSIFTGGVVGTSLVTLTVGLLATNLGYVNELVIQRWLNHSYDRLLGSAEYTEVVRQVARALVWPVAMVTLFALFLILRRALLIKQLVVMLTLVDLIICGRAWITTTPMLTASPASAIGRFETICWANLNRADIQEIRHRSTFLDEGLYPYQQSDQLWLQTTFLVGKLAHFQNLGALHASGSLRPVSLVRLERWLARNDDLTANQPKLDDALAALGVHQRLIRSGDGRFRWHSIEAAKPLCEVGPFSEGLLENAPGKKQSHLNWRWLSSSTLQIDLTAPAKSHLVVRQYNDGRWRAINTMNELMPIQAEELFVVIQVPAGPQTIRLER